MIKLIGMAKRKFRRRTQCGKVYRIADLFWLTAHDWAVLMAVSTGANGNEV